MTYCFRCWLGPRSRPCCCAGACCASVQACGAQCAVADTARARRSDVAARRIRTNFRTLLHNIVPYIHIWAVMYEIILRWFWNRVFQFINACERLLRYKLQSIAIFVWLQLMNHEIIKSIFVVTNVSLIPICSHRILACQCYQQTNTPRLDMQSRASGLRSACLRPQPYIFLFGYWHEEDKRNVIHLNKNNLS